MNHITSLVSIAAVLLFASSARAEATWSQDYEAARKHAVAEHLDMLVEFTGSDWCAPCIALRKTVLSTSVFEQAMKDKFVLVELDYPSANEKQTPETVEQNQKLKTDFNIPGFPTIVLCDAEGQPYASQVGFGGGDPSEYVARLIELLGHHEARDKALADARTFSGVEKAKRLSSALQVMELEDNILSARYKAVLEEIKEADPADSSGLLTELISKSALTELRRGVYHIDNFSDALKFADGILAQGKLQPGDLARGKCIRAELLAKRDVNRALQLLGEVKEETLDDGSKAELQRCRGELEKQKKAEGEAEAAK